MLLLKYPSPSPPNGPQSFVDDAIYLRDNFSVAGGAKIISKYSGKSPPLQLSASQPSTPIGQSSSPSQRFARTKSPLPSPARFLQQQGGVEALLQGAAKGVFDRGERLGINQAVRDAMGEVKKNMQGLQASRPSPTTRRTSDVKRWSLDEGRSVASTKASPFAMNNRNKQLARMLDQAMSDLRAASISTDSDKETYVKAMDLAIAKVEFVKVYLEDSSMPLSPEHPQAPVANPDLPKTPSHQPSPSKESLTTTTPTPPAPVTSNAEPKTVTEDNSQVPSSPISPGRLLAKSPTLDSPAVADHSPVMMKPDSDIEPDSGLPARPKAPVPTRSSIANSSFSWMLEPDMSPVSGLKSSPPKSVSPFLKSGKRPTSGPSREKAAFLFGEDGDSKLANSRPPLMTDADEGFNLKTMRSRQGK